jgi:hypothetical protein
VPKPRAVNLLSVYLAVKPVGKPDAGNRLVRFDERGWETERCRMAQATAPILDSTEPVIGPTHRLQNVHDTRRLILVSLISCNSALASRSSRV